MGGGGVAPSGRLDQQAAAHQLDHAVRARVGRVAGSQHGGPGRAAVADLGRAVGAPGVDLHGFTDVEVDAALGARVTVVEFMSELKADKVLVDTLKKLSTTEVIVNHRTAEILGDGSKVTTM